MARSDQVKALMRSYREGDDQRFRSTAQEIIDDARKRRHDLLANELEAILDGPARSHRPSNLAPLRALPKGRDEAPLLDVRIPNRMLTDVVLDVKQREVLTDVLEELRCRDSLLAHGVSPRSAIVFTGPPGTGKSLTAEAMAGELGWPIARVQLASVVSSYLGETSKNLRQIFDFLSSGTYVLLFDEFDMLARDRGEKADHGELKRVVGALLQLIDDSSSDSLVIATTNHADLMDLALWRRFDEVVGFGLPDRQQREAILRLRLRGVRSRAELTSTAEALDGASHAEVESVAFDSLRLMIRSSASTLSQEHLAYGLERMEERRRIINSSRSS